jgi:hypothetical protein
MTNRLHPPAGDLDAWLSNPPRTTIAFGFISSAIVALNAGFLLLALLDGYDFAWVGHLFVEKIRPATFRYALWSFIADWRVRFPMLSHRPLS